MHKRDPNTTVLSMEESTIGQILLERIGPCVLQVERTYETCQSHRRQADGGRQQPASFLGYPGGNLPRNPRVAQVIDGNVHAALVALTKKRIRRRRQLGKPRRRCRARLVPIVTPCRFPLDVEGVGLYEKAPIAQKRIELPARGTS